MKKIIFLVDLLSSDERNKEPQKIYVKLYNEKENGVLVSLTVFCCLGCAEIPAIQTETFAEKDPS